MDPASKRPGSVALLVGLVLLVMAAGLFAIFVPCATCPCDKIVALAVYPPCKLCDDTLRISFLRKWHYRLHVRCMLQDARISP